MKKVRPRIISLVLLVYCTGILFTLYGLYAINRVSQYSEESSVLQRAIISASDVLTAHFNWRQELNISVMTGQEFSGSFDHSTCSLSQWVNNEELIKIRDDNVNGIISEIVGPHQAMHEKAEVAMGFVEAGNMEEAQRIFIEEIYPPSIGILDGLQEITTNYEDRLTPVVAATEEFQAFSSKVIIAGSVIGFFTALFLCIKNIHDIMVPLRKLSAMANMMIEGNLQANYSYDVDDEIGALSKGFNSIKDTMRSITEDLGTMASNHAEGDIEYFMEEDIYQGAYRDVIAQVNGAIKAYIDNTLVMLNGMKEYADGNFDFVLAPMPGKQVVANEVMNTVRQNLIEVKDSTMELVNAALLGDLDAQIDLEGFNGDWANIISGMNELLRTIAVPLDETSTVLAEMSKGNLNAVVVGEYKGKFAEVKNSLNSTVGAVSSYISEITEVLGQMAEGDLTVTIDREYLGQFEAIRSSINLISSNLNRIMTEIDSASEQLLMGASQISETSMTLAEGATEQAVSISTVTESAENISIEIQKNAENSKEADSLSKRSIENSKRGNEEMELMLKAMEGIETASSNISNIIKVIEDISSQTNLLAINAAVEAARAGVHGKGFSVVAEEVRSLATKSKGAAQETTKLIEDSIERVQNGISIANKTNEALNTIMEDVNYVSDIIGKISVSSQEQAASIEIMNEGIAKVSDVINANSATSEESAAAAEELNSQADMLKKMVDVFKL